MKLGIISETEQTFYSKFTRTSYASLNAYAI